MKIKHKILVYTKPLRHDLARFLAPKLTRPPAILPRPMVEHMVAYSMFGLVGAEIGVQHGEHAKTMLELLRPEKLFLIDPYLPYIDRGGILNDSASEANAHEFLKKYAKNAVWIKQSSPEALENLPPLDFVYIDGSHEYESVLKDLWGAWLKLKRGGILGGHDFCANFIGVCDAVLEFTYRTNVKLYGRLIDYWIVKP